MANKKATVEVEVKDKSGSFKKVAMESKKAGKGLDNVAAGAQAADRNIKGTAQASSNASKNFSKMSQGMGGFVGAYATLAANVFALSAAFNFLKSAGDLAILREAQINYASATGTALRTLSIDLQNATLNQISFAEASQAAAIGVAAGLDNIQIEKLGKAALAVSNILGRDLTDSFNRLVRGITKAEPELLDELGIILRLDTAVKNYKTSLGIAGRELTIYEKSQAVFNEVITQSEEKYQKILEITGANANAFVQLAKEVEKLVNKFKLWLNEGLTPVLTWFVKNPVVLAGVFLPLIKTVTTAVIPLFGSLGAGIDAVAAKFTNLEARAQAAALAATSIGSAAAVSTMQTFATTDAPISLRRVAGTADAKAKTGDLNQLLNQTLAAQEGKAEGAFFKNLAKDQKGLNKFAVSLATAAKEGKLTEAQLIKVNKVLDNVGDAAYLAATQTVGFGTKVAGFISRAFGWIGVLTSVVSVLSMLYAWFKSSRVSQDELSDSSTKLTSQFALQTERLQSMNDEYSKFVALQEVILGKGEGTLAFFENFGKMSKQLATTIGTELTGELQQFITEQVDATAKYEELNNAVLEGMQRQGMMAAKSGVGDAGFFGGGVVEFEGKILQLKEAEKQLKTLGQSAKFSGSSLKELIPYIDGLGDEASDGQKFILEFGKQLENQTNIYDKFKGKVKDSEGIFDRVGEVAKQLLSFDFDQANAEEKFAALITQFREAEVEAGKLGDKVTVFNRAFEDAVQTNQQVITSVFGATNQYQNYSESLQGAIVTYEELSKKIDMTEEAQRDFIAVIEQLKGVKVIIDQLDVAQREYNVSIAKSKQLLAESLLSTDQLGGVLEQQKSTTRELRLQLDLKENEISAQELIVGTLIKSNGIFDQQTRNALELLTIMGAESFELEAILKLQERKLRVLEINLERSREIRNLSVDSSLLQAEQQIVGLLQKQAQFRAQILASQQKIAEYQLNQDIREVKSNPFLTDRIKEQQVAKLRLDQERSMFDSKKLIIEREYELKVNAINLEYDLLEKRLRISELEARNKAIEAEESKDFGAMVRYDNLASAYSQQAELVEGTRQRAIDAAEADKNSGIAGLVDKLAELENVNDNLSDTSLLLTTIGETFTSSFSSAIDSLIQGTASVKDAFKNMALAILKSISEVIAQLIVANLLKAALSGLGGSGGGFGSFIPSGGRSSPGGAINFDRMYGFRQGGIVEEYSKGGIARGREAGYPAILHGTEAVVPLPNGNKIPVEMMNGRGQNNNVTVNVSVDNQGKANSSSQQDSNQAGNLGKAIAKAVQTELQNQKRSGGILNPYGVA